MIVRDTRAGAAHFSTMIEELDDAAAAVEQEWAPLPDHQVDAAHQRFEIALYRVLACYARGQPVAALADAVAGLLPLRQQVSQAADTLPAAQQVYRKAFERFGGQDSACGSRNVNRYQYALWWLSLVVATGQPAAHVQQVVETIDNAGRDALLDRLIALCHGPVANSATDLLYPACYQPLLEVFDHPPAERGACMRRFLDGWYAACEGADWCDSLENFDDAMLYTDLYVGYWCLEAALVTLLLNIDDSDYRDHAYYPADLVDYARSL